MDGLGRVFNVIPVADDVLVPMKKGTAVSFVCYLDAGDTYTVSEYNGTTTQVLACVDHYFKGSGVGGAWTEVTLTANSAFTLSGAANNDAAVFTVHASQLSDGYTHVKCASTSTGTVVAILHDLTEKRYPGNLAALV
jgi:hypothetical protein